MSRLTTRPLARNLAMARLGVGAGARIAAHSLGNVFRSGAARDAADRAFYRDEAETLAETLGSLKGSVMKAGQMLSLYAQYFLPPEAVDVLAGLQDDTPPVDWAVVEPVLRAELGRARAAELEIDPVPLAAASLGQAHRARRRRDGAELVLKLQYPGVAEAIDSDVATLSRVVGMTRLAPSGLDMAPVFDELRDMLYREVDYEHEAECTIAFAERLADDPRYIVPRVYPEYSSQRVLALSFEPGVSLRSRAAHGLPQAQRDALAEQFVELFLREFFDWGMVQTDPHFGNYRLRLDEGAPPRLVLLDFGATRRFDAEFVDGYRDILAGGLLGPRQRIEAGARRIGLIKGRFPPEAMRAFSELVELVMEPFRLPGEAGANAALMTASGAYRYGASDLPPRVGQKIARNSLTRHFRVPPREIVFLHRRLAGAFMACAELRAELAARDHLLPYLQAEATG